MGACGLDGFASSASSQNVVASPHARVLVPSAADDRYFGGKPGSARKAYEGMVGTYGLAKGEQVFMASLLKRKAVARARSKRRVSD